MKTQTLTHVSGMILLVIALSLALLVVVYALQNHHLALELASVSWNA